MARIPGTARAAVTAQDMKTPQTGRVVRAFQRGFYNHNLIEVGMTFTLIDEGHYAPQWMEFADGEPDILAKKLSEGGSKDAKTRKNAMKSVEGRHAMKPGPMGAPGDALSQNFDEDDDK